MKLVGKLDGHNVWESDLCPPDTMYIMSPDDMRMVKERSLEIEKDLADYPPTKDDT